MPFLRWWVDMLGEAMPMPTFTTRTLLRIALFYSINLFFSGFFRCLVLLYAAAAIHLNVHEDT